MENVVCAKTQPCVRKVKKKQGKDEMDRMKQAEKKKRRLEKALATSAAIRLELEKKKQQKKEEQQRLDEEGAAIAEAVALNVLLGEDSEDSCKLMLKTNSRYNNHWDLPYSNVGLFADGWNFNPPHHKGSKCSFQEVDWVSSSAYDSQRGVGVNNTLWSISSNACARSIYTPSFDNDDDDLCWGTEDALYADAVLSAQCLSSLQIAEDSNLDSVIFNGI